MASNYQSYWFLNITVFFNFYPSGCDYMMGDKMLENSIPPQILCFGGYSWDVVAQW